MARAGFLGPRPWAVVLPLVAFGHGALLVATTLRAGLAYPNQFWEASTLALWPLGFAVAARLGWRHVAVPLAMLYAAHSLVFGFGYGGPHLTFGVPLVLAAIVALYWRRPERTRPPTASP